MIPRHRNRRIGLVLIFAALLVTGAVILTSVLKENTQYFYDPSEIISDNFDPKSETIKIGGLVLNGSIQKQDDLQTQFDVGDFIEGQDPNLYDGAVISVSYRGVLPDLFREGQGVVVTGRLVNKTHLEASDVLAKHDENYQPAKDRQKYKQE